jgi:CheY-like chemotaxis protein
MSKEISCIMLIDDNPDDNFFHEREIKKVLPGGVIITKTSGLAAIQYLKHDNNEFVHPDLILLDINMPGMNGWEFLKEYDHLGPEIQSRSIIIMLTTSESADDLAQASGWSFVYDFKTKPLTKEMLGEIIAKYKPIAK